MNSQEPQNKPIDETLIHKNSAEIFSPSTEELDRRQKSFPWVIVIVVLFTLGALIFGLFLVQQLTNIQENVTRQSADTSLKVFESITQSKQAQDLTRETAAKAAVLEEKFNEMLVQRKQLEDTLQNFSRSREDTLLVDLESSLLLAEQQAELTGAPDPLLKALNNAQQRIVKTGKSSVSILERAIRSDIDLIKSGVFANTPQMITSIENLVQMTDDLVSVNAMAKPEALALPIVQKTADSSAWWQSSFRLMIAQLKGLIRVTRIDHPEAALSSPGEIFFLKENIKLRMLSARLGLMARQTNAIRTDLNQALRFIKTYFEVEKTSAPNMIKIITQLQLDIQKTQTPKANETLSALTNLRR